MSPEQPVSHDRWTAVEGYISEMLVQPDAALDAALAVSRDAGLPDIQVSPNQGKLLHLLARMQQARNVLEIGTLGGYSTIWLARALPPDGRVTTLEIDPRHAEIAAANFVNAGVARLIDLRLGPALETLPRLQAEGRGPFDLIFIDADKPSNPEYFNWAMRLSRRGTLIIVDNVVRDGAVLDANSSDAAVQGVRRLNEVLAKERRVMATALQTVGSKGYDGFAMALVTADG